MNILVIGNGFDLAHGLPTKYTDFLEFVKVIKQIIKIYKGEDVGNIDWGNINAQIKELIEPNLGKVRNNLFSQGEMWSDLIGDNVWIEYFLQCNSFCKENWIDFEREISNVVQSLEKDMHGLSDNYSIDDEIVNLSNGFLHNKYSEYIFVVQTVDKLYGYQDKKITFREIRDKLLVDLNKLVRALEIYLCEYVEKIDIKEISPDINKIAIQINPDTHTALPAKVLSFNYTNIYEKVYLNNHSIKTDNYIDYIHGKADINNTIETNNMVLGIDEYLGKKRRNKDIEFIAFKKFYQRIHKQTGCKYKEWVEIVQKDAEKKNTWIYDSKNHNKDNFHNLYIFGHSLDVTDKDTLRDLILNDNIHTTIYYLNKDIMGQQIANLVKVIGQDELIRKTGGNTKTIEFKQQQDMVLVSN